MRCNALLKCHIAESIQRITDTAKVLSSVGAHLRFSQHPHMNFKASTMQQVPLASRLLASVAYNPDSRTLHVWFRNKRHATHQHISEAVYLNLINAESAGFY